MRDEILNSDNLLPDSYDNEEWRAQKQTVMSMDKGALLPHELPTTEGLSHKQKEELIQERLLLAYRSTYGAGISPEAVPEMLAALKDYEDGTSLSVCFRCLSDLLPKEETSWIEWLNKQGEIIDAVLEKSRL